MFIILLNRGERMNKNIIIAILIVIIIAVVGAFVLTQPAQTQDGKLNTQISFLSQDTLKNGQNVEFELKDAQGNAIKNEKLTITYEDEGKTQTYSVLTDNNGHAFLALNNEAAGQHKVKVAFNGTDKYNGCSAEKTITIEDGTDTSQTKTESNATASTSQYNSNQTSQSSGQSSTGQATQTYYDADLNVYYDSSGKVIGGQAEGANIWDLRNNPQQVSEDGYLE